MREKDLKRYDVATVQPEAGGISPCYIELRFFNLYSYFIFIQIIKYRRINERMVGFRHVSLHAQIYKTSKEKSMRKI